MTRRKDGRYQAVVTINGKRIYFLGKTRAEVQKKMLAHRERAEHGAPFAQIAAAWWEKKEPKLAPNSLKNYSAAYRRAVDRFELRPCACITPQEIAAHVEQFAETHAAKTVKTQISVYNQIFRFAVAEGAAPFNPARDLPLPECGVATVKRHGAGSDDLALIKANAHLPFGLFPLIALYTGLRLGEILALTWEDVDIDKRLIFVRKSLCWVGTTCVVKTPKTETSLGKVPIIDALLPFMVENKGKGLIFKNEEGKHLTKWQYTKALREYKKTTGVTTTAHPLRHSFTTMLFEADIKPEKVQALVRHAQLSTTMDVYKDWRENKLKEIYEDAYKVDIS